MSLTNFTLINDTIQLKINFNTEIYIRDDVKLRLVKNIIERMNLSELKKVYSSYGRKSAINPVTMLQILIFCYSEGIFSSRAIEKACEYDLRIKYLLDTQKPPDHSTINRFRQKIVELTPNILNQMVQILIEENQIDLSSIYIDGTKLESYASRYSFVWRGSIEKFQEKLRVKAIKQLGLNDNLTSEEVLEAVTIIFNEVSKEGIYISETVQYYREISLKNITSPEGIEERINRTIQAEGAFSKIKDGLSYKRFKHKGKSNIKSEINLLAIALNLNKLGTKIIKNNLEIIKHKAA
ncbi:transposase [Peptoniphilus olsenii]|uniref:Transposase n=1 Tax=Peptoniphilus olsenii TaxID=411570 RepID=A0ABV2JC52_9FIRM